jgi:hypothetical protein
MFRIPKPYFASGIVALFLLLGVIACVHSFHRIFIGATQLVHLAGYWALFAAGAALTALAAASLFFGKPSRENAAILLVSMTVAVYLSEVALWYFNLNDPQRTYLAKRQAQGAKVDFRTQPQLFLDLRNAGVKIVPTVSPSDSLRSGPVEEPFPLSGVSRAYTSLCKEGGEAVNYTSDEHGYRNPGEVWRRKPPVDVVLFGDSFAQGVCMEDGDDMASLIRGKYPSTVNLAFRGTGPLIQLATMSEYLPFLRPRVVLWFYYENDLDDLEKEMRDPRLRRYLAPGYSQDLIHRQEEVDGLLTRFIEKGVRRMGEARPPEGWETARHWLRLKGLRNFSTTLFGQLPHGTRDTGEYARIVALANQRVAEQGGTLYLVLLPDYVRMNRSVEDLSYRQKDRVLAAASRSGVPVIDVLEVFRRDPSPARRYFDYPGSHYNRSGYQAAAGYVLERIGGPP